MDWSEQTLRYIYEASQHPYPWLRHTVGDAWPYDSGSEADVEQYLHKIVTDLEHSELVSVESYFDSYGSGYASFVEAWCSKKDGSTKRPYFNSGEQMTGILVYISRLAPVAVYGAEHRTRHAHGGSSNFLEYNSIGATPSGDWTAILNEVFAKLEKHGVQVADAKILNQSLTFEASIETNLGEKPYRVFDLLFHWYD